MDEQQIQKIESENRRLRELYTKMADYCLEVNGKEITILEQEKAELTARVAELEESVAANGPLKLENDRLKREIELLKSENVKFRDFYANVCNAYTAVGGSMVTLKAALAELSAKIEEDMRASAPAPAPVVEKPKAVEPAPVIEEVKVEEPAPAPAPVVEEVKVVEPAPVIEEPKVEEPAPVVEEPKVEEPAPVVEEPKAEEPAFDMKDEPREDPQPEFQPLKKEPAIEIPKVFASFDTDETSEAEEPAPAVEEPEVEEPAPVVEEPKAEEPAPFADAPKAEKANEDPSASVDDIIARLLSTDSSDDSSPLVEEDIDSLLKKYTR